MSLTLNGLLRHFNVKPGEPGPTLDVVAAVPDVTYLSMRNFGRKCMAELRQVLAEEGVGPLPDRLAWLAIAAELERRADAAPSHPQESFLLRSSLYSAASVLRDQTECADTPR